MNIHFISIGGSVMHQLAIALKRKGYNISGSDDEIFEPAKTNLLNEGILPSEIGWNQENIRPELDAVILGMHAKEDNPELQKARELGLTIYSFPEYIYQESLEKTRIVVGGSHGKTTTTSMIMHVLRHESKEFDYLVGAKLQGFDQSVNITNAPIIVCEGDEYPASAIERKPKFHFLYPHVAILTGIAWDHINVFPTFDNYLEQFRIFISRIEKDGLLIYNETDTILVQLVQETRRTDIRYQPYGIPPHEIVNGETLVTLDGYQGRLNIFGNHNLLNLHAAYYACKSQNIYAQAFLESIENFKGAAKRLELLSSENGTMIYRDFAHAPSKVMATMQAVKAQFPDKKVIAVLELHTYSSLNEAFMNEYQGALDAADVAVVFYSSHALEIKRMPFLDPEKVKQGFNRTDLLVFTKRDELEAWLRTQHYDNTTLLLMSSGNYDGIDVVKFAAEVVQS